MVSLYTGTTMGGLGHSTALSPHTTELSTLLHCVACSIEHTCVDRKGLSLYGDKMRDIKQGHFNHMIEEVDELHEDLTDLRKLVTTLGRGVTAELAIAVDELLYDMIEHVDIAHYKLIHHNDPVEIYKILKETCEALHSKFNGFIKEHKASIEHADYIMLVE